MHETDPNETMNDSSLRSCNYACCITTPKITVLERIPVGLFWRYQRCDKCFSLPKRSSFDILQANTRWAYGHIWSVKTLPNF